MRLRLVTSLVLATTLLLGVVACGHGPQAGPSPAGRAPAVQVAGGGGAANANPGARPESATAPGTRAADGVAARAVSAADDRTFGAPRTFGNLAIYPVTSRSQVDAGPLIALEDALASGAAEVREVDGSGSVNTLVIENKGTIPMPPRPISVDFVSK